MQGLRTLSLKEIEELNPGDVLLFYDTVPGELFGKIVLSYKPKLYILQAKEDGCLYFTEAGTGYEESGKYDFFIGRKFTKLSDDDHPPVVKDGNSYSFLMD